MIRIGIISFALALSVTGASAQTQGVPETTPSPPDSHSQGTAPGGMGSTGWTGGTGGAHIGTSNAHTTGSSSPSASSSEDQPLMATGRDLQGPPTRFPANKTPE